MSIRRLLIISSVVLGVAACSSAGNSVAEENMEASRTAESDSDSGVAAPSDGRELDQNVLDTHAQQCRDKIVPRLTAPETVEWEPGYNWNAHSSGDYFNVDGEMTSENHRGVRGNPSGWWCEYSWNGHDWQMTDFFVGDRDNWLNEERNEPDTISWTLPSREVVERGYYECQEAYIDTLVQNDLLRDETTVVDMGGDFQADESSGSGTFYGSFTADGIENPYNWKCDVTLLGGEWIMFGPMSDWSPQYDG